MSIVEAMDAVREAMTTPNVLGAIEVAVRYGGIDGAHHKAWVVDQMVRQLTGCPHVKRWAENARGEPYSYLALGESDAYLALVEAACAGEDGPDTYEWNEGIIP